MNRYDRWHYPNHPHAAAHPDRLATMGRLFGLSAAPIDTCCVLEVGCSTGHHLLPIAASFPNATFVGLDASASQLQVAEALRDALGLTNVRFVHADLQQIDAALGSFDYILAHGVFSWVDDAAQHALLGLCHRHLADHGIAYIDYNTYPGWHMRSLARDFMRFHAERIAEPEQQVCAGREALDLVAKLEGPEPATLYRQILRAEVDQLSGSEDAYIFHDQLAPVNTPRYFLQFMEAAASADLQYLGDAEVATMWDAQLPAQARQLIASAGRNLLDKEQYRDFVRNRFVRETLLCKAGVSIERNLDAAKLAGLFVATELRLRDAGAAPETTGSPVTFEHPRSKRELSTTSELTRRGFELVASRWPGWIAFDELVDTVVAGEPSAGAPQPSRDEVAEQLGNALIESYLSEMVELHAVAPPFVITVSDRPVASPVARQGAVEHHRVINRRHEYVAVDAIENDLLSWLDGEHDLAALAARVRATHMLRDDVEPLVMGKLERFARCALLIA